MLTWYRISDSFYAFLKTKVQDAARDDNREQTPQLQAAGGADVSLR